MAETESPPFGPLTRGRDETGRPDRLWTGLEPLTHGKGLPCSASSGLYGFGVPHTRQGHARLKNRRRPLLTPPHMPKAHRMPWSNPALSGQIAHMPRARRNLWAESPKPSPQRAKAHKATPVHGKPPPLWVQGPKTGEKKGGKPGKRARPPTVSRLYTTDGVFFSPCTERSVLQCS